MDGASEQKLETTVRAKATGDTRISSELGHLSIGEKHDITGDEVEW